MTSSEQAWFANTTPALSATLFGFHCVILAPNTLEQNGIFTEQTSYADLNDEMAFIAGEVTPFLDQDVLFLEIHLLCLKALYCHVSRRNTSRLPFICRFISGDNPAPVVGVV